MSPELLHSLAVAVSAAGLVCLLPAVLGRASWRVALGMMLELLTAAGLLQLGVGRSPWRALAVAAVIISLRRVVMGSLLHAPALALHRAVRRPRSGVSR